MKKNVIITMKQIQGTGSGDDAMNFVTDGTYTYENNIGCLRYLESDVTGMRGTATSVSILPDKIVVNREGLINSRMEFCKGVRNMFQYDTPYGTADMRVDTKAISHHFDASGGTAEIDYVLDLHNRVISRNKFIISVEQQGELSHV